MGQFTYIYGLVDPRDDEIRYVGKANNPERRYMKHVCRKWERYSVEKYGWMRSEKFLWVYELWKLGMKPRLCIIERCPASHHKRRERYWIERLGEGGRYMVNGTVYKNTRQKNRLQMKYIEIRGALT